MIEKIKKNYKWVIFAACAIMLFFALGFCSSTKSTYTKAVTTQLDLQRSLYTINDSFRYGFTALISLFFGFFMKKFGPKKMVLIGFGALVASMLVYANSYTYWHFYIGGALLGFGLAFTSSSMASAIIKRWFTGNIGTVMGLALCFNGLGGMVSEQIVSRIIYGMDGTIPEADSHWRTAYIVTSVIVGVAGIIVFLLMKDSPASVGITDNAPQGTKKKRGFIWEGQDFSVIKKKPYFYIGGIGMFAMGFVLAELTNVAKPHMYDVGISKEFVIAAWSIHSLVLMASKIISGISYDYIGLKKTFLWIGGAACGALACLYFVNAESTVLVWIYSIISSLAMPMETILATLFVTDMFGLKTFDKILGYYHALSTLGSAIGVPITNLVYDKMHSYTPAIAVFFFLMAVIIFSIEFCINSAEKDRDAFLASKKENAAELKA